MKQFAKEWAWILVIALIAYIGWLQILPYKLAIEQHAAIIAQMAQIRINPDRTLTWIGELPKKPTETAATTPPPEVKKQ